MLYKKRDFKIGILSISIFIIFQIISLLIFYFQLSPWRKAWILSRLSLISSLGIEKVDYEDKLFTIPNHLKKDNVFSKFNPKKYIKERTSQYIDENLIKVNQEYLEKLSLMNDSISTLKESKKRKYNFVSNLSLEEFKKIIKYSIGFNPIKKSKFLYQEQIIYDRNNIPLPVKKLSGSSEKIIIALHGRRSSPEAVNGNLFDYSNSFGKFWNNEGYTVYSLAVASRSNISLSFPRLGLTLLGSDLAKIEDLLLFLKEKYKNADITIVGISYGAKLAELSGILFEVPNSIVSIGGAGRYDFLESKFSMSITGNNKPSSTLLDHYLLSGDIFKFINKTGKLLHISVGIADAGSYGDSGHTKFRMLREISQKMTYPHRFSYEFFEGHHETNPISEIRNLEKLKNSQLQK